MRVLAVAGLVPALAIALNPAPALGQHQPEFEGKKRTVVVIPPGDFLPRPIAGPHQRGNAVTYNWILDSDVPRLGSPVFGLKLGGRFGLIRVHPAERPDLGWQFSLEAGWLGLYDVENNYDNLGYDGFFGMVLTHALGSRAALEIAAQHTSGHLGDEYIRETGRERIGYTRTELMLGGDLGFGSYWRTYGQLGYGYGRDNEIIQNRWRMEAGLEYRVDNGIWGKRFGWYAAVDLNVFQERDWQPDFSAALGLLARSGANRWRLGLEYYDGRVPLGEFVLNDQRRISIGLYIDLNAYRTGS